MALGAAPALADTLTASTAATATVAAPFEPEPEPIEQIVITGSRRAQPLDEVAVTTELLTERDILLSGAENLTELLEEHPGIEIERSTRGASVRLMGLNPEHTLILVDGERTTGRVGGAVDTSRFAMENVQQVEIVKGAASAIYGSEAIAGVINLIPRQPEAPLELSARATYGSFGTIDASGRAGVHVGDMRTVLSGGFHTSDGYDIEGRDVPLPVEPNIGPAFTQLDIANTTWWRVSEDLHLRGRVELTRRDVESVDAALLGFQEGAPIVAVTDRKERMDVLSMSLRPEIRLGDGQLRLGVGYERFRLQISQDQRDATEGDAFEDIRQGILQVSAQVDQAVLSGHIVTLGVEGLVERQEASFVGVRRGRERAAVYFQDEWKIHESALPLTLVPSVRVDSDSQFGTVASPRLSFRLDFTEPLSLRGSFGWGFRAPSFEELYLDFRNVSAGYRVQGNEALQPERSQAMNLEMRFHLPLTLEASASFFYINLEDLIDTQRVDPVMGFSQFSYVNVESARTEGVEVRTRVYPLEDLEVDLGYVFTATRDRVLDRALPGRARHRATLAVAYELRFIDARASARGAFFGPRPFFADLTGDGQPDEGPAYFSLDARFEKTLFDAIGVFGGVENILDAGDPNLLTVPPRAFYVGARARYDVDTP